MRNKKSNSEKPTFSGGLKKGYKEAREMSSTPKGRLTLLFVFGSMLWLFFLAPASWMKLEEVFPHTGIGFFVGLLMYVAWFVLLFISSHLLRRRRNIRLFGKPKPSFKEATPYFKEVIKRGWEEIKKADD